MYGTLTVQQRIVQNWPHKKITQYIEAEASHTQNASQHAIFAQLWQQRL